MVIPGTSGHASGAEMMRSRGRMVDFSPKKGGVDAITGPFSRKIDQNWAAKRHPLLFLSKYRHKLQLMSDLFHFFVDFSTIACRDLPAVRAASIRQGGAARPMCRPDPARRVLLLQMGGPACMRRTHARWRRSGRRRLCPAVCSNVGQPRSNGRGCRHVWFDIFREKTFDICRTAH